MKDEFIQSPFSQKEAGFAFATKSDILGLETKAVMKMEEKFQKFYKENVCVPLHIMSLKSFEELLRIDEQREKDGFEKKIKIRKVLAGQGSIILVPSVEEEKLLHGEFEPQAKNKDLGEDAGHGEGEEGDVIGEIPLKGDEGEGEGDDSGGGEGEGEHGIETDAYQEGKRLTEEFQLPNLKDKGKKVPTDEYTYELTDRHRGSGQLLDKKETLKAALKTNIIIGRIDPNNIDVSEIIIAPRDKIYRIFSRERVWKSQAQVFFMRDYSGSMFGDPTKAIVAQHLMIYVWLVFQYEKLVIPRFIIHDTEAKEVSAENYFKATTGGGTLIASGYKKINEIVDDESLDRDYNIYVFQGTDGEDFDGEGKQAIPEIQKILSYVNRMGVCILKNSYSRQGDKKSEFQQYIEKSNILEQRELFRMHIMPNVKVSEEENREAVKELIAQD